MRVVPDAISAPDFEPSFNLKFTDGALNGLDALAGRVGNRLIGRPRLLGVAVQMRGDDIQRHGPRIVAQILVAAELLKPLQIRTHGTLSRTHAFQACALNHSATCPSGCSVSLRTQKRWNGAIYTEDFFRINLNLRKMKR